MRTSFQGYFTWLIRHRLAVLVGMAALVAIAAAGASRVRIDYTIEQFFPGWGPERETYDRYKASFPKEDAQISLFWKDSRSAGVALYRDLQRAAAAFERAGLDDVQWLGSFAIAEVEEVGGESGLRVHPLIEEEKLSDTYIKDVLSRYRDDDNYRGFLWNSAQGVFAVHGALKPQDMGDDLRRREIEETLAEDLSSLEREGTTFALSGIPVVRSRIPKLLDEDQRLLVSAALILFLAVFFVFFRHIGQVALCLLSVFPAYLCTVGLIGLAGKSITVLTGFIPIIVLVVGGSDIVHLLSRYRQVRLDESDNTTAVVEAFSDLAIPCFYTSLTTAIGFLSLIGTRIAMVMDFGAFTAVAIFLTFGFSMTLLPVLLSFYARKKFDDRGLQAGWIRRAVEAAVAVRARPSRRVVAVFFLVALLGLGLGTRVRTDAYLVDDLKQDTQLIRDLRWIEDEGFGLFQVNLFMEQTGEEPLHHPAALSWMEDFQAYVRDDPVVAGTIALPDYLKSLRRVALGGNREDGTLPSTLEESSQLIFLAELQDADFFTDVYRPLEGEAQVIVMVRDEGSIAMRPFLEKVDRFIERNPPPVGTAVSTGTVKLILNYTDQVLRNFGPSLVIAVILILGVMSHMFRSIRHGLLALIPNFFPLLVLMGVMKVMCFDLKPSTILVFSIAFGIAVDDSIHVLSRFRQAVAAGTSLETALEKTLRDTGPAILMTSLVVSVGFSLLMASRFEVLFLVGFMTTVSAVAAVSACLFAFPSLIALVWGRAERCQPITTGLIVEA
ncbi:MAG: hypothetical protein AMS21_11030 [Gemmatimonas sp. SG8_38_2]|nr:MAG: hypothetical protein AMS21_11030 [Gemmatimonas sp. SG8_38_2]